MFFMMFLYDQISQQIDVCILLIYLNDVYIQHMDNVEQYVVLDLRIKDPHPFDINWIL
jgi:hypothetical protein